MKKIFCIVLMLATWADCAYGNTPTIGVMLGNKNMISGAPSSAEKLCIVQALNELSDINFRIYENHRSQVGSIQAARSMIEDKIDLALLPLISDEAIAATPILQNAGIPFITSATSESVIKSSKTGLSVFPENRNQAEFLAEYYLKHYSSRPLAIVIDESSAYSKQLSAQFVAQLHIMDASIDVEVFNIVGDSLLQLPNLSGYAIFAAMFNPKIALLYRQMSEDGDVIMLGGDSIGVRKEFLQIAGNTETGSGAELFFLKNWDGELKGTHVDDFWSVFYNGCSQQRSPTFINAYTFDMASLAMEWALKHSLDPPLQTIQHLERNSVMDGAPILFTERGYRVRNYYIFQYSGGYHAQPLP